MKDINKELKKNIDKVNKFFDEGEANISLETKKNNENVKCSIIGDTPGIIYCLKALFGKLIKNNVVPAEILIALINAIEIENNLK